ACRRGDPMKTGSRSDLTNIWRWNAQAGYWALVRDAYRENVARWLEIFRSDEPGVVFKASKKRPHKSPGVTHGEER
ncbi:hypothetical protein ACV34G_31920, partial [Pseudomonas aeruginosa]